MALFKSASMTHASGSVGGMTYSHNRGGLYMRARRKPTNPNTGFQQAVRQNFQDASAAFKGLSVENRASWATYAAATPRVNRLGDAVTLTAQQMFVATASFAGLMGKPLPTAAPGTPGVGVLGTDLTFEMDDAGNLTIGGIAGSAFRTVGAEVGIFIGDGQSHGRTFYKSPYQLFDTVAGATGTATALTIPNVTYRGGTTIVTTMLLPIRVAGIDALGRLTNTIEDLLLPTA